MGDHFPLTSKKYQALLRKYNKEDYFGKAMLIANEESANANRGPITQNEIDNMKKLLNAPVELFLRLI